MPETHEGETVSWPLPPEIDTPSLVVDHETLLANIDSMGRHMADRGVALRPHAKTHKSPDIGRLQIEHGACGLTVATLGEAEVFAAAGIGDVFIAYPLYVSAGRAPRLCELASAVRLSVGVDSVEGAAMLAASGAGGSLQVLIEIDCGQHRSGVLPADAGHLAVTCERLGLHVEGVFTHGGHGYKDVGAPGGAARDEAGALEEAAAELARHGIEAATLSAGSTPTALSSAGPPVTEERPGTYVFHDRQQLALGSARPAQVALSVAATVVSTAVKGQVVLDAGSKSLASDRPSWVEGHGIVPELGDAVVVSLSECHGVVRLGEVEAPPVGTVLRVVPNHVCTVVNLFDHFEVVSKGTLIDRYEITARGHLS